MWFAVSYYNTLVSAPLMILVLFVLATVLVVFKWKTVKPEHKKWVVLLFLITTSIFVYSLLTVGFGNFFSR